MCIWTMYSDLFCGRIYGWCLKFSVESKWFPILQLKLAIEMHNIWIWRREECDARLLTLWKPFHLFHLMLKMANPSQNSLITWLLYSRSSGRNVYSPRIDFVIVVIDVFLVVGHCNEKIYINTLLNFLYSLL